MKKLDRELIGLVLVLLLLVAFNTMKAQQATIDYQWPITPCTLMLTCDTGCAACNRPEMNNPSFQGTGVVFYGVPACPEVVSETDGAMVTSSWPNELDTAHWIIMSGIAYTPFSVDSVIVDHRTGEDGPERVRVTFGINENLPEGIVADEETTGEWTRTAVGYQGCVSPGQDQIFGFFQIMIRPYGGGGGGWFLTGLRIVGSPCVNTGVEEINPDGRMAVTLPFDAAGRAVKFPHGMRRTVVVGMK